MQESESRNPAVALHVLSLLALAADMGLLVAVGYLTLYVQPNTLKVFADFDAELPAMTQLVISIPTVAYLAGLLAVAAVLVLKEILVRHAAVKLAANLVVGLAMLAFGALVFLALVVPLAALHQSLA